MKHFSESVTQALETYKSSVFAKDVDTFMSLYHKDTLVFDTWGVWSCSGAAAWRKMIEGWFSSLGVERVNVSFDDIQTIDGQNLVVVNAIATYAGVSAEGVELRAMQNRFTWVLKKAQGVWKVAHEHTSVPVDFDEAKAILQYKKVL